MTTHSKIVATLRTQLANRQYADALEGARAALGRGYDSSEVLILATCAGQLGEGDDCTLDEIRLWLEQAAAGDPRNVEAPMELGHFLDAVADEPSAAARAFDSALERSIDLLEVTLDGIASTIDERDAKDRARLQELLERAESRVLAAKLRCLGPSEGRGQIPN